MLHTDLQEYLDELESSFKPLDELTIANEIERICRSKEPSVMGKADLAELLAFRFIPKYTDRKTGWGTYYGPTLTYRNDQNEMVEFPSIQQVDDEVLFYWRQRANSSKHPFLASRYAGLVVDFEPVIKRDKSSDRLLVQKVIESTIEICDRNLDDALGCKARLKRALELAVSFNDRNNLEKLKRKITETEEKFAQDEKAGLWGYAFQWLVLDNPRHVSLSPEDTEKLIRNLELRLGRLGIVKDPDPWRIEHGAKLLAEYYARTKNEAALEAVLLKLESAFRMNKHANSDGLLVVNYLERLSGIYHKYGQFNFAKLANRRIVTELSNLGDRGKFTMQEYSVEVPIKKEDVEYFIDSVFGKDASAQIEDVIIKLAVNFVPKKNAVSAQLKDLCQKYIFKYLAGQVVTSPDGYPIAKYGSINEDYDQHLLQHFSEILHFESYFLSLAFEEIRKRFTAEDLFGALKASPLFRTEDQDYTLHMLGSFWKKDYASASSLMIPLIEDAVRGIFKMNGVSYIKANTDDGYDVLPLNNLLHHGLLKDVFGDFGENVQYYFQVLLTEGIGWNLRNNFAHGINKRAFLGEVVANRLLHVLFCLSLIRSTESS